MASALDCPFTDDIWAHLELDSSEWDGPIFNNDTMELFIDEPAVPVGVDDQCLIQHDCMWTGLCGSKEHNDFRVPPPPLPVPKMAPTAQQSLLKPAIRMNNYAAAASSTLLPKLNQVANLASLHTPPMSDDEEPKQITQTLQNLHDAIFENAIETVDGDLVDYFKDKDFNLLEEEEEEEDEDGVKEQIEEIESDLMQMEEEEEEEDEDEDDDDDDDEDSEEKEEARREIQRQQMRAFYAAESDHSYHKGNHGMMRGAPSLGIDTPSDSDEEIDVVNVDKKLPTNPSRKDRYQLQRTMQSRFTPGSIKTMMPIKRSSIPAPPLPKNARALPPPPPNRTRTYKRTQPAHHHRQYKRRTAAYGHSSDSEEQEPSEKRNLHNNMERQRRIDLRNLFEDLKTLVPEVNKKQRAAKVLILRGAAQYCRGLTQTNAGLNRQVDDLKKYQERLLMRVSLLRRNLAAHR